LFFRHLVSLSTFRQFETIFKRIHQSILISETLLFYFDYYPKLNNYITPPALVDQLTLFHTLSPHFLYGISRPHITPVKMVFVSPAAAVFEVGCELY
jgi:hypothetical protein